MKTPQSHRLIETFLVVDLLLGAFAIYDFLKIVKYLLSLLLQGKTVLNILANRSYKGYSIFFAKYILVIICTAFIGIIFYFKNIEGELIINRIFPLLSMFGFVIFLEPKSGIDLTRVLSCFCKLFVVLALIINIDSFLFIFVGKSLWQPMSWMGLRYSGPFGDPNFYAIFSATVLLTILFDNSLFSKYRKVAISILVISLLLAMALSTLILLPISIFLSKCLKGMTHIQKQMVVIGFYLWFISFYAVAGDDIFKLITNALTYFYGDVGDAVLKYSSLEIRLDTQVEALGIFFNDIWGQGPQQIVTQLNHDTHNSYLSVAFADGIFGLIIIFLTLTNNRPFKVENVVGTFLMLSALLLNIHELTIYSLFILMQNKSKSISL